jgi:GT2 family glycosyltransferase
VILVNHNGKDVLPAAVDAIQRNSTTDSAEIIVVDSGSADGSASALPPGRLPVRVITCDENVGFCRGNNIGAEAASGRVLCFTQSDGEVEPGWDAPLLRALEDPTIAVAGGVVMKMGTNLIDSAGIAIAPNLAAWSRHENEDLEQAGLRDGSVLDVVGVSPALLAVRATDHARIGGFWESLWMYGDEPDYALRIRARGRAVVCTGSRMQHRVGSASGPMQSPLRLRCSARNKLLNIARHVPSPRLPFALLVAVAFDVVQMTQRRDGPARRAITKGWREGFAGMAAARRTSTSAERAQRVQFIEPLRAALKEQQRLGRLTLDTRTEPRRRGDG